MVKELAWYLEDNRFTNIMNELKTSVQVYGEAKQKGMPVNEINRLKEQSRLLFEDHCIRSGLREKDASYINIDREFFEGGKLDEDSLDVFIKNIVKKHCHQKTLWLYMGTTGSLTEISKREMKNQGHRYENYLPIMYKDSHDKNYLENTFSKNAVPIYMYSDGSVSCNYNNEKAQFRYDALKDQSGMHWKKTYNSNDMVEKNGWHGTFDETGTWVKEKEKEKKSEAKRTTRVEELKIIKCGDNAILYDPRMILLNSGSIFYLSEDGEVYGSIERDIEQTLDMLRQEMISLGVKSIHKISAANPNDSKVLEQYKKTLDDLADSNVSLIDIKTADAVIEKEKEDAKNQILEMSSLEIERTIRAVPFSGKENHGDKVIRTLKDGIVSIPLSLTRKDDCKILGLNETEISEIEKIKIPEEHQKNYDAALSNLYAGWSMFAGSGLGRIELAEKVKKFFTNGKHHEEEIITAEVNLETLLSDPSEKEMGAAKLYVPNIPGGYREAKTIDFYNERECEKYLGNLEKQRILPSGGMVEALKALQNHLPKEITELTKEKINRSIMRGLKEYQSVSMSTGMKIHELIEASIRFAAAGTMSVGAASLLKKKVFYEFPLWKLIKEASRENYQSRGQNVKTLLHKKGDQQENIPIAVIGGNTGKPLTELGFDSGTLKSQYAYGKNAAFETASFLQNIRINESFFKSLEEDENNSFVPGLKKIIAKEERPKTIKKSIVTFLESHEGIGFNVSTQTGLDAYIMSRRYKASGLNRKELQEIIEEQKEKSISVKNISSIVPKYRDAGIPVSTSRKIPRGMPEKIFQHGTISDSDKIANNDESLESFALDTSSITENNVEPQSVNKAGIHPVLIINEDNKNFFSITEFAKLDTKELKDRYGYGEEDAANIVNVLSRIYAAKENEDAYQTYVRSIIEELTASGKNKDSETLCQTLLEKLKKIINESTITEQSVKKQNVQHLPDCNTVSSNYAGSEEKLPQRTSGYDFDRSRIPPIAAALLPRETSSANIQTDPETIRLRRIEAEYEKEKAEWAKKNQPVLARSAAYDLGRAEVSDACSEADKPEKIGRLLNDEFIKSVLKELL